MIEAPFFPQFPRPKLPISDGGTFGRQSIYAPEPSARSHDSCF